VPVLFRPAADTEFDQQGVPSRHEGLSRPGAEWNAHSRCHALAGSRAVRRTRAMFLLSEKNDPRRTGKATQTSNVRIAAEDVPLPLHLMNASAAVCCTEKRAKLVMPQDLPEHLPILQLHSVPPPLLQNRAHAREALRRAALNQKQKPGLIKQHTRV